MKNLLNQDLVSVGASGEWVLGSGEWILGSGEWLPDAATLRRLRYRKRMRKLARSLQRHRALLLTACWRGVGLGLAFTLFEALTLFAMAAKMPIPFPPRVLVASAGANLLLCLVLALVSAPLLNLRRGAWWLCLVNLGALGTLLVTVEATIFPLVVKLASSVVVALLFLAGVGLSRWHLARRALPVAGLAATLLAWAGALHLAAAPVNPTRQAATAEAPNVLLIVLDTLRADRLGVMGYERDTFPWLTAFAREGAVFERAVSAAPLTVPSHASMFTGLYPSAHGATQESNHLQEDRTTLAEVLGRHGWDSVALSSNPWISKGSGLAQGFEHLEPVWQGAAGLGPIFAYRLGLSLGLVESDLGANNVTESWRRWLASRDRERPFFAFLNYAEPHFPYHLFPKEHRSVFSAAGTSDRDLVRASKAVTQAELRGQRASEQEAERVRELYDAAIRYQAGLVEHAVEALRERGELDRTLVVIVADHGEQLGENGGQFNHSHSLANPLLSVPLVVRYPARVPAGVRIDTPVTTAALMPTILDLAGLDPPEGLQTRSFTPLFEGNEEATRSPLLSECYRDDGHRDDFEPRHQFDRLGVRYRALEEDGWKLIVDSTGQRWLFRPVDDPSEIRDLSGEHPEIVDRLSANLDALVTAYGLGPLDGERDALEPAPALDAATRDRLRSLGYLGG